MAFDLPLGEGGSIVIAVAGHVLGNDPDTPGPAGFGAVIVRGAETQGWHPVERIEWSVHRCLETAAEARRQGVIFTYDAKMRRSIKDRRTGRGRPLLLDVASTDPLQMRARELAAAAVTSRVEHRESLIAVDDSSADHPHYALAIATHRGGVEDVCGGLSIVLARKLRRASWSAHRCGLDEAGLIAQAEIVAKELLARGANVDVRRVEAGPLVDLAATRARRAATWAPAHATIYAVSRS